MDTSASALISIVIAIILTIPIVTKMYNHPPKTTAQKIIDKAAREGHYVTAKKIKQYRVRREKSNDLHSYCSAVYAYTVNNRTYRHKASFRNTVDAPQELTLYYDPRRPGKAYDSDFDKLGARYTLVMMLPIILFLIVFAVMQIVRHIIN